MLTIKAVGKEFTLKNDGESEDVLTKAAQHFQEVISELEQSLPEMSRDKLLLLAGLELAQQHIKNEQHHEGKLHAWSLKLNDLKALLDEHKEQALTLEREVGLSA